MRRDRRQRVLAARRVEPAPGLQRRAYPPTVRDDRPRQHTPRHSRRHGVSTSVLIAPAVRDRTAGAAAAASAWPGPPRVAAYERTGRHRQRAHHQIAYPGQGGQPLADQVPQPAADPVAHHRTADRACGTMKPARAGAPAAAPQHLAPTRDRDGPGARRARHALIAARLGSPAVNSSRRPQSMRDRQHGRPVRASGRQAVRALGATRGQHRAAGPGPHTQPEAVGLGAPAVVRLVRALAHCQAP